jgi:hypothetical protein
LGVAEEVRVIVGVAVQLSVAVAVPTTVFAPHETVVFAGQVIDGCVLSVTVTLKEHVEVPQAFETVRVTVVTPRLNEVPLPVPVPEPVVAPDFVYETVGAGLPPVVGV